MLYIEVIGEVQLGELPHKLHTVAIVRLVFCSCANEEVQSLSLLLGRQYDERAIATDIRSIITPDAPFS